MHGRNKLSVTLDLKSAEGKAKALRLARRADALVENFRPGQLERLGLGPEALHAANPRLVIARVSGYGQDGPYRDKPAFGAIGEAMGGLRHLTANPGQTEFPPPRCGVSISDDLAGMRDKLLAERNRRPHPHTDDKVLAGWNGLMIGALAHAGRALDEPSYTRSAERAATFILDRMTDGRRLLRSYRADQAKLPAYLDDYAYLANGLVDLYEATGDRHWLDRAVALARAMREQFEDQAGGGFYFTSADHDALLVRSKNLGGGGNTPSPNGAAAIALLRLGRLAGQADFDASARRAIGSLAGLMDRSPGATADLVLAAAISLEPAAGATTPSGEAQPGAAVPQTSQSGAAVPQTPQPGDAQPGAAGPQPPDQPDARWTGRPVSAELFAERLSVRPGQGFRVAVAIEVADGFHVYAPNPGVEALVPTTVSPRADDPVSAARTVPPQPQRLDDPVQGVALSVYRGRAWFVIAVTIRPDAPAGPRTLIFDVRTQACDDRRCLAPVSATLELKLDVDPAAPADGLRHAKLFAALPAPAAP